MRGNEMVKSFFGCFRSGKLHHILNPFPENISENKKAYQKWEKL